LFVSTSIKKARKRRVFTILFRIGPDDYFIYPLPIDPSIGHQAFRFAKQTGDRAVYDLYADRHGLHCECRGFERWGHCKHVQTLQAAAKLFHLDGAAAAAEPSGPMPSCAQCGGPLECYEGEFYCPDCTRFEAADPIPATEEALAVQSSDDVPF
jgi:hypothetical protein